MKRERQKQKVPEEITDLIGDYRASAEGSRYEAERYDRKADRLVNFLKAAMPKWKPEG